MNNKYYYLLLIPAVAFVIVVGAGMWYANQNLDANDSDYIDPNTEQPFIYEPEEVEPDSYEARMGRLQNAISHFRLAKTFSATVMESTEAGKLNAELTYVKPLRIRANLKIDGKDALEMIIVGETAYAKLPKEDWKMTNDEYIRQFGRKFFEGMVSSDDSLSSFGVSEDANFKIKQNGKNDCLEFSTNYKTDDGELPISFCINDNDEIVKISKQDKEGSIDTFYSNYNQLITIERPVLPVLDPTLKIEYQTE